MQPSPSHQPRGGGGNGLAHMQSVDAPGMGSLDAAALLQVGKGSESSNQSSASSSGQKRCLRKPANVHAACFQHWQTDC